MTYDRYRELMETEMCETGLTLTEEEIARGWHFEDQPNIGPCWHISISVPKKWPNEHAVDLICQELLGQPIKDALLTWTDIHSYPQSLNLLFIKK